DPDHLFSVLLRWIRRTDGHGEVALIRPQDQAFKTASSETELAIPGIDVRSGLKRTGGQRERDETLLRKFAEQQLGATEAMRVALSGGDAATAERTAHSLKGSAGTLGAVTLSDAAAKAETAIKARHDVGAALTSLPLPRDA